MSEQPPLPKHLEEKLFERLETIEWKPTIADWYTAKVSPGIHVYLRDGLGNPMLEVRVDLANKPLGFVVATLRDDRIRALYANVDQRARKEPETEYQAALESLHNALS